MKLIIYWLTLMFILPLLYLFWQKKTWRLFLGIIILIVLIVGLVLPGKLAFSILKRELEEVEIKMQNEGWMETGKDWEKRSWKKLEQALENTLQQQITSENQEKIALEKEIIKWREEIKKTNNEKLKLEREKEKYLNDFSPEAIRAEENIRKKLKTEIFPRMAKSYKVSKAKEWEWSRRWGGRESPPVFLFAGEEFNHELTKERKTFKGSWQIVWDKDWHSDVVDFEKYGSAGSDFVQKRIREIWDYWNSGITRGGFVSNYPIILFKNVDKITNSELQKELLLIADSQKNYKYSKYQIKDWFGNSTNEEGDIDLSRFILVFTTSTASPKLPEELQTKLKHIQPFLDKYFWLIFISSTGIEIIIFFYIKRKQIKKTIS